ncbi:PREDICTED: oxysterol-binding protein-related protein 8 isoform X2 [Nicrophorus vespilloides]|uniref:Oxysterol-binding protein n=1 Tax=Nicrophorus vespilloides TaxID=110193 RepID=A0ABM1M114_NICVS|nr:PREDICTED: oxysterol-binding protein-related protein 8 isoform X2 [Nicrophorus vespilloides]
MEKMSSPQAAFTMSDGAIHIKSSEEKKAKGLFNVLSKLPSNDSLSNSPGPSSPGLNTPITILSLLVTSSQFLIGPSCTDKLPDYLDKLAEPQSKLTRKESYKAQRKNYRKEKKRVTNELLNSLKDPSVVVLADWLKVRGTLKSWTKLWCVLKPGMLLLYKSAKCKSNHWVGTILLNSCKVIERPSKKDGFCFKLYNPLDLSIWAPRGPENESIGAVIQPLPNSHTIFRASSQESGMCWLDALEISIRNDSALVRSVSNKSHSGSTNHETQWSEADYEKHFDHDLDDISQLDNGAQLSTGDGEITDSDSDISVKDEDVDEEPEETPYTPNNEEEFGDAGAQVEELADEHKSLIWYLVKQVRPGMDLSKVVLPTFILEPRSFLDKLADSYYHVDILSSVVLEDDAFTRMKSVVKWYLSGLYKKPKGLKKPYNPILGEAFRCYWLHPNGSKTYYIAEQVSHHPPVSAFYVSNRQEGFSITASILAKSKFYGNSTSAILDGIAILTLMPRGENYTLTVPYAHCKGILMGTLSMELGGKVTIECEKTGYYTEIEFKLKPFLGGVEQTNCITGRLKLGKETLATIEGYWDGVITIKDRRTGEQKIFWNASGSTVRKSRLKRYTVPLDQQEENESERLWQHVSAAILRDDMNAATEEKTSLEEVQRALCKERKAKCEDWMPTHFQQDLKSGQWVYKFSDLRPWDPRNDLYQYEHNYVISTRTKHATPMIRSSSISESRSLKGAKRKIAAKQISSDIDANDDTASESEEYHSDSTQSGRKPTCNNIKFIQAIENVEKSVSEQSEKIEQVSGELQQIILTHAKQKPNLQFGREQLTVLCVLFVLQTIFLYYMICTRP